MTNSNFSIADEANQLVDQATDAAQSAAETVSAKAAALKNKTQEIGRAAINKIDENRSAAASALHQTASSLHGNAQKLPNGPEIAHSAARRVDSMADYLDGRDSRQMLSDVGAAVKKNPIPSLVIAAITGFVIGRTFRSR